METVIRFILAALVLAMTAGCGETETQRRLRDADAVMESDPDSALTVLATIDRTSLEGEDLAYYALLKTQGDVKTDVIVDSDSLISIAQEYYAGSKDGEKRKRAAFYTAQVAFYRRDYPTAMRAVLPAYEYAKENKDHYWTAKAAELMADVFAKNFNYNQAEKHSKKAVNEYLKAGKILNHRYAICDLAIDHINNNQVIAGLNLLDSLFETITHEPDPDKSLMSTILISARNELQDVDGYENLKNALSNDSNDIIDNVEFDENIYNIETTIKQNPREAKKLIDMSVTIASDSSQVLRLLYLKYLYLKYNNQDPNQSDVFNLTDSLLTIQSKIARQTLSQSVSKEQSEYYESSAKLESLNFKNAQYKITLLAIIMIMILGGLIFTIFWIRNKSIHNLEAKMDLISSLQAEASKLKFSSFVLTENLKEKSDEFKMLQNDYRDLVLKEKQLIENSFLLYKDQWKLLNMLSEEYYENKLTSKERDAIIKNIQREINKITDRKKLIQIERSINFLLDDVMTKLRKECAFLKEDDFVLLLLTYAGFSAKAICIFIDIKYKNYYRRKYRIIEKITEANTPNKDLFLSLI